ncbi:MAG: bifunctional 3-hydroxydecanoyl-ACP dehydratase/trans-2-decenoyl-ACP isomerase [Leptonema sp. (in: Bacteria)]|nr:bifunctional 3-hydroxydecanoyl-ACP dehydratase/trans-2-decenoyl-ACP isomerase [Leptonema sp. (in: bacteria)]
MKYLEFIERTHFTKEELLAFSQGNLVEDSPHELAKVPAPPFLMMDRVTSIVKEGKKGRITAEKDVQIDEWYFQCHFRDDPVMPGCLGVDAIWQLLGFYCCVNGAPGSGRALGAKEIEFLGQIRPHNKVLTYELEVRRFTMLPEQGACLAIANGSLLVDGQLIYQVNDAKVGLFLGIGYKGYPNKTQNHFGGLLVR